MIHIRLLCYANSIVVMLHNNCVGSFRHGTCSLQYIVILNTYLSYCSLFHFSLQQMNIQRWHVPQEARLAKLEAESSGPGTGSRVIGPV